MRKVIYSEYIQKVEYNDGSIEDMPKNDLASPNQSGFKRRFSDLEDQGEVLFHQWGVDSPCEGSTFSTAIIELEDGTVKNIPAEHVRFVSGEI
jgi:hypothetical protein